LPTRNEQGRESGRETRVGEVSQEAARTQLNALPVAGRSTSGVLPQPPTHASVSPEGGNCPAPKDAGDWPGNGPLFVPVQDKNGEATHAQV
jgi:hypothetical protein